MPPAEGGGMEIYMKNRSTKLFLAALITVFILNNAILVDAHETHPKLDEYRAVLNELNLQYNTRLEIPIEDEVIVYENIKNLSLTEFRNEMVLLCEAGIDFEKDFSNEAGVIEIDIEGKQLPSLTTNESGLRSIREEVTQRYKIKKDKYIINVFLAAEIFSDTGKSGTFKYSKIIGPGYTDSSSKAYFYPTSFEQNLSSDEKTCTVTYTGYLKAKSGVILPTVDINRVKVKYTAEGLSGNGTIM